MPTHRRDSEKCSLRLAHNISCFRLFALRTSTCPERRQVRCCRTHLKFAKLLFRRCLSKRMMPDRKTPTFIQLHRLFFFAHIFSFCSFLFFQKKRVATRSTFAPCLRFPRFRTCLNETSVGKIGAVGGLQHRKASAKLAPIVVLSVSDCCTLHVTPQPGYFVFSVVEREKEKYKERER